MVLLPVLYDVVDVLNVDCVQCVHEICWRVGGVDARYAERCVLHGEYLENQLLRGFQINASF